jgi:hypothetical protein
VEITNLAANPNKTTEQQAELESKKKRLKELEKLLAEQNKRNTTNNPQPSDKTALVIGCGIIGIVLVGLVLI